MLPVLPLVALEPCRALPVVVALADARLQVLGVPVIATREHGFAGGDRVVAVVPVVAPAVAAAARDLLPLFPLEALESRAAMRVAVALAGAGLQVLGVRVIATRERRVPTFCCCFVLFCLPLSPFLPPARTAVKESSNGAGSSGGGLAL